MKLDEIEPSPLIQAAMTEEELLNAHYLLKKINSLLIGLEIIIQDKEPGLKYLLMRPTLKEPTLWTHIHTLQKMFKKELDKISS